MTKYEQMTKLPVSRLIVSFSIPTALSMLITNIYNLVDTAFVSRLGTSASGAVGVVFGFMTILQAVGYLCGQGAGNLLARHLGEKNQKAADEVVSTGFFLSLAIGGSITAVCLIFIHSIVFLFGSTPTIAPYAVTYIFYILLSGPFIILSFTLNILLRYEGHAVFGTIALLTGGLLNIAGDALLMFVLHLGIAGAGISTAVSQIISFCLLLSVYLRKKSECRISVRLVRFRRHARDIVLTGFPSLMRQGLHSVTAIALNFCAGGYGDFAVAGMSIVSRVIGFIFAVSIGIAQGFQPLSAFNYGAGLYSRVRKGFRFTVAYASLVAFAMSLYVFLNHTFVISLFRDDPDVIMVASRALRLQCIGILAIPYTVTVEMVLQSTGYRLQSSVLAGMRSGMFFVPLVIILNYYRDLPGLQEAQMLAYLLTLIPSSVLLHIFFRKLPQKDAEA